MAECKIDRVSYTSKPMSHAKRDPFIRSKFASCLVFPDVAHKFNGGAELKQGARAIPSHFHVALAALKITPLVSAAVLTPQEVITVSRR